MGLIIVLVVIILLVLVVLAVKAPSAPQDQNTSQESTTGNATYDFINESTGVDLFDKE